MDWTVSTQDLIASTTVSWLLRTVFRISSCTSCGVLGMMCSLLLGFVVANYTKHWIGKSSGALGINDGAGAGTGGAGRWRGGGWRGGALAWRCVGVAGPARRGGSTGG